MLNIYLFVCITYLWAGCGVGNGPPMGWVGRKAALPTPLSTATEPTRRPPRSPSPRPQLQPISQPAYCPHSPLHSLAPI